MQEMLEHMCETFQPKFSILEIYLYVADVFIIKQAVWNSIVGYIADYK